MIVKLLAKHVIGDREWPVEAVLTLDGVAVTPLMEGLDQEARDAITECKRRIFGRNIGTRFIPKLLDDPPIEYPLDNPPVSLLGQGGPPR